jgi:rhodanese-related sulfurtransferase
MSMNLRMLTGSAAGQALLIVVGAAVLGFGYAGLMKRGFFGPAGDASGHDAVGSVASTFLNYSEARTLYARGGALFIDARHAYDFDLGHIKGAMNLPLSEFDSVRSLTGRIPKDTLIVTYCDGEECNSSIALALKLSSAGYSNVRVFFGGWKEWVANHQPVAP